MKMTSDKKDAEFQTEEQMVRGIPCRHTGQPVVSDRCVHQCVEEQVERTPDVVAVVGVRGEAQEGSDLLTYGEVNARANRTARLLRDKGVGPDTIVAIVVERALETVMGILAILKAGGAYLPIDPRHPEDRILSMLNDSGTMLLLARHAVISHPSLMAWRQGSGSPDGRRDILLLDRLSEDQAAQYGSGNLEGIASPTDLAYLLYTSGSTGRPKGVAMGHLPLSNLIAWHLYDPALSRPARTLQFAPLSFDVSFQEIFSTWCAGGTLLLISEEERLNPTALSALLTERGVERLFLPFVALQQLADATRGRRVPDALREVVTAGEQLQITASVADFFRRTGCTLHNHYGPTETHVVTAHTLSGEVGDWPKLPPIGRPILNTQAHILDLHLLPVPTGSVGELHLGGDCLARGYLNRPEMTGDRFIPNPFGLGRLYKTGDLARHLPDGVIEYLGRSDHQVKIRGFRVEPGEIEVVLSQHPAVRESAVIPWGDGSSGNKQLVAYVVPQRPAPGKSDIPSIASGKQPPDRRDHPSETERLEPEFRAHLREHLPDYMIPTAFVLLDQMPLTSSGKVNRRALPAPDRSRPTLETALVMPQTDAEQRIARIWGEMLQLETVGIHDNFFDLGGHSILMTRVHQRLTDTFGPDLSIVDMLQYPTIHTLARHLTGARDDSTDAMRPPPVPELAEEPRFLSLPKDIAIIGMSCRFPGANDLETFWRNLCEGVESVSFFSEAELESGNLELRRQPDYVRTNAILSDIDQFDAAFFGYSDKEAEMMDPQHRLFLECAWEAIAHAGYDSDRCDGRIGVYSGAGMNTYLINNVHPNRGFSPNRTFLALPPIGGRRYLR